MIDRVSYWLMPAGPGKSRLAARIRSLARRVNGPLFAPHVTLYSGAGEEDARAREILRQAARVTGPLVLAPTGVGHTEQFTRTLFLEFAAEEMLLRLSAELQRLAVRPEPYELKPHLSLAYAALSEVERQALADAITAPEALRFDAIQAVRTGARTESRRDVESWQFIGEERLA